MSDGSDKPIRMAYALVQMNLLAIYKRIGGLAVEIPTAPEGKGEVLDFPVVVEQAGRERCQSRTFAEGRFKVLDVRAGGEKAFRHFSKAG